MSASSIRNSFGRTVSTRRCVGRLGVLFAIGIFSWVSVHADPVPLTQDSYIANGNGQTANQNHGNKSFIQVSSVGPKQGLVQFDLSALGGLVSSATLTFNVTDVTVAGNVDLHLILNPWNENTVTFNTAPTVDPGRVATFSVLAADIGGNISFDISAIAQVWINNPSANHGVALVTNSGDVRFSSKEGAMGPTLDVVTDGSPPPPPPPPPGAESTISSVLFDFVNDLMFISGQNFDNGNPPVVELGDVGPLVVVPSPTATMIEAALPIGLLDGDYVLTVTTGPADSQIATYDLTVDRELTEAEVDAFVADNGFAVGPHYTDAEAIAAVGPHTTDTTRSDAEILAVVGPHYTDADALLAVGPHYTDAQAVLAVGPHTVFDQLAVESLGFVSGAHYSDAEAIAAVGPHGIDSDLNSNTAGGTSALTSVTTGGLNTALGFEALFLNTSGSSNTALGSQALRSNTSGISNTATGAGALDANTDGRHNTAVGAGSLGSNTIGQRNTAVGVTALASTVNSTNNTAVGYAALRDNLGVNNSALGVNALFANTLGSGNTAVGSSALQSNSTGSRNTVFGLFAANENETGSNNVVVGSNSLSTNTAGNNNTALGVSALPLSTGSHNIALGAAAGFSLTTGSHNIAIGNSAIAGESNTIRIGDGDQLRTFIAGINGNDLTATGTTVVVDPTGQLGTTTASIGYTDADAIAAVGPHYMDADAVAAVGPHYTDAQAVLAVGPHTVLNQLAVENLGFVTGAHYTDAEAIVAVGPHTTPGLTSFGFRNTRGGVDSLPAFSTGTGNTALGFGAMQVNSTGRENTAVGSNSLSSNTSGAQNTAIGNNVLSANTTGARNIAIGHETLPSNTFGGRNIGIGVDTLKDSTSGSNNTAVGDGAMFENVSGSWNTAIGSNSLQSLVGGHFNTAIGALSMIQHSTGQNNVAIGWLAFSANTGSFRNVVIGSDALRQHGVGDNNTIVGASAFESITNGFNNIGVGFGAGANYTAGNNLITIGHLGVDGESNTIRLGTDVIHTSTFIAGIRGTTTGVADAINVVIDSNGQLGTVSSSRRYKEQIADIGTSSERLMELRPVTFRYKKAFGTGEKPIHYGLIAEEVAEVFPSLVVYNEEGKPETVKYRLLSTLLLNELQKQAAEIQDLSERLATMETAGAGSALIGQ